MGKAVTSALLFFLFFALLGCRAELQTASPSSSKATWTEDTDPAWQAMQQKLVGHWKATTPENRTITTDYRVISKGSALAETFTSASGKETMSLYHRDGRTLMLTHYCAQGNQARLKAVEASADRVVFAFLDVTNVGPDQGVMHRLAFVFRPDGFDQESTYRDAKGAEETATLHFVRETP